MGLGGISIWQLAIILLIVILIFGTKKLKGMGKDLGGAIKSFKDAMNDDKDESDPINQQSLNQTEKRSSESEEKKHSESK